MRVLSKAREGAAARGTLMKAILADLVRWVRARRDDRRKLAVQRAKAQMTFDETHGGSIWKSGKGGTPHPS